jgi:hypothetical protein
MGGREAGGGFLIKNLDKWVPQQIEDDIEYG